MIRKIKKKELLKEIPLRTNEMYKYQALEAEKLQRVYFGIHGYAKISDWISIPDQVYYEMMHMVDIGTWKWMFNSLFDSRNKDEIFYSGKFDYMHRLKKCFFRFCYFTDTVPLPFPLPSTNYHKISKEYIFRNIKVKGRYR